MHPPAQAPTNATNPANRATPASRDDSDDRDDPVEGWRRSWHARSGRLNTSRQWALAELAPLHRVEAKTPLLRRAAAVAVEIGAGSGEAAVALAVAQPGWLVIAAEVHTASRATMLLAVQHHGLANLAVEAEDGRDVLTEVAGHRRVDLVRILFPDPWPKRRHHPRRLVTSGLVNLLHRSLRTGGVVELATDDTDYARAMAATFGADDRFRRCDPRDLLPAGPPTYYERRARQAGRSVATMSFAVRSARPCSDPPLLQTTRPPS